MIKHETQISIDGVGITSGMTPICSCGWEGVRYEHSHEWQYALVKMQIIEHLNEKEKERK